MFKNSLKNRLKEYGKHIDFHITVKEVNQF